MAGNLNVIEQVCLFLWEGTNKFWVFFGHLNLDPGTDEGSGRGEILFGINSLTLNTKELEKGPKGFFCQGDQ